MILFQIIVDLFRDQDLSGWWKAVWIIFLIIVPFLSALVYVIARGREWPSAIKPPRLEDVRREAAVRAATRS